MQMIVKSGFVSEHSLHGVSIIENGYVMEGQIACHGGIIIDVRKVFEIIERASDDDLVQTKQYKYNASVRGAKDSTFLRYDNAHPHPGHEDNFHRHDVDWQTGKPYPGSPTWVGLANWPFLSDFVGMVEAWYNAHRSELPNPEGYPSLGTRESLAPVDEEEP